MLWVPVCSRQGEQFEPVETEKVLAFILVGYYTVYKLMYDVTASPPTYNLNADRKQPRSVKTVASYCAKWHLKSK